MNDLIKFKLSDLCRTCIHQMMIMAVSGDAKTATAIRKSTAEAVRDLEIIERDVQNAINFLTGRMDVHTNDDFYKLGSGFVELVPPSPERGDDA